MRPHQNKLLTRKEHRAYLNGQLNSILLRNSLEFEEFVDPKAIHNQHKLKGHNCDQEIDET